MSYWDAAYVAKFYLDEPESDRVRVLAEADGQVSGSRFGYVETVSVFHRKMREGAFGAKDMKEILLQLEADSEAGLWTWLPVSPAVLEVAGSTYRHLPKGVALRAGERGGSRGGGPRPGGLSRAGLRGPGRAVLAA